MGCFGSKQDYDDEAEKKLDAPPDFDGPIKSRGCTDILCALLLFLMWGGMTVVGSYAIDNGDYRVVLNPIDYDGNVCGVNYKGKNMIEYPNIYYVNLVGGGVCVKECPQLTREVVNGNESLVEGVVVDPYTLVTYGGIFQVEGYSILESDFIEIADYSDSNLTKSCTANTCYPGNSLNASWFSPFGVNQGYGYALYAVDTREYLNRCIPTNDVNEALLEIVGNDLIIDALQVKNKIFEDFMMDVINARTWIFGLGFGVAVVLGFTYLIFIRCPLVLKILVWGGILASIGLLAGAGYFATWTANGWAAEDPLTASEDTIYYTRVISYILYVLSGVLFLLVIYFRKEIQLAIAVVKVAARAINSMPLLTFLPIFLALGMISFLGVWVVYAVYLASLGTISIRVQEFYGVTLTLRFFDFDDDIRYLALYLLFCLFWTYQFILSMNEICIGISVSKWYFTRDKSIIMNSTVFEALCASLYHTGTAAFGSLIMAIVKFVRYLLHKIQTKFKKGESKVADAVLCCFACCLWCLENFIRFINRSAFIETAIFGTSFCVSCRKAFYLIARNAGKVASITGVTELVCFIGKFVIAASTTTLSYILIEEFIGQELHSLAGPCLLIFFLAYNVADAFLDIFEYCSLTILYCFIADDEMFEEGEAFADGSLRTLIDDWE